VVAVATTVLETTVAVASIDVGGNCGGDRRQLLLWQRWLVGTAGGERFPF
jgi:hypothetical protein